MNSTLESQALNISYEMKKISPFLLMRKLSITQEMAEKLCLFVWKINHADAGKMAKEFRDGMSCNKSIFIIDK